MAPAGANHAERDGRPRAGIAAVAPGCHLEVTPAQRADLRLAAGAGSRGSPLILVQIGNKRTMRRGLRRLAVNNKYWPNERWAEVLATSAPAASGARDRAAGHGTRI